jgi:hypothetical protein
MKFAQFKGGRKGGDVRINPEAVTSVEPDYGYERSNTLKSVINLQGGKSLWVQGTVASVVKQLIEADA